MKKTLIVAALGLFALSATAQEAKKDSTEGFKFTVVKENPITSVKNQNRSGTCWAYSSLGFFEAELLRMGKGEIPLCESFLEHKTYEDRAVASVRMHGDISFSQGGSFYDAVYCMKNYGMVPRDAMPAPGTLYGDTLTNFNELFPVLEAQVSAIAKSNMKKLSPIWKNSVLSTLDNYIGKCPTEFMYKGKKYTPESFQKMMGLNLDDYVSLTSFTHHPFYDKFIIEVQDNWRWEQSYNLPLNEFMEVMKSAVENGYTFAWGADVSELGFDRNGIGVCPDLQKVKDENGSDYAHWFGKTPTANRAAYTARPLPEIKVTQELRQEGYDNWETTDDHGMVIYGIAKDQNGKDYFMVKNSWGTDHKYNGIWYVSEAFVAYKTMNILINKNAIPKAIAKKLGLK